MNICRLGSKPQHIMDSRSLEDLDTHTSGLPHNPPNMPLNGPGFQKYTLEQMYQVVSNIKLTRVPGTKYHTYSISFLINLSMLL